MRLFKRREPVISFEEKMEQIRRDIEFKRKACDIAQKQMAVEVALREVHSRVMKGNNQ
ncbi:hypothetical protein ACJROX_10915 [Pseudalkalibacillus sp. A8]|uniref:hypothetical protein n=1 Tax=Pseudalkalibacillus sp. A8 TaxID=3382641 RepID=UPI0038B5BEE2